MIEAYKAGADLHRLTAAAVLGKAPSKVSKKERQLAKACNFGLLYGMGAPGLVRHAAKDYSVTLSEAEAKDIRTKFFRTYTPSRAWHETKATTRRKTESPRCGPVSAGGA